MSTQRERAAHTRRNDPADLMALVRRLYPICRSITGDGVRETFDVLAESIPLQRHEIESGTPVFDWEIPREWNIRDAWIRDEQGRVILQFSDHNLHVVSYSAPVHRVVTREELCRHVFTLPDHPAWIPYRTSYYAESWGFCMAHERLAALPEGRYEVMIDSTLEPGALTLAECIIPGESDEEVLLSTHVCHPSMCNDNLSGVAVLTGLCQWLAGRRNRLSYRAVFVPGTIGALAWLHLRRRGLYQIGAVLVLCGLGDAGAFTYKRSRAGDAEIDRIAAAAVQASECGGDVRAFTPYGYDERQYCAPGIDLPVGRLTRTPYGEYPEYHTSADNLDFVSEAQLQGALALCRRIVEDLESNRRWIATCPYGEPRLGKYELYDNRSGGGPDADQLALLWVLNLADGRHTLVDMAERSTVPMATLAHAAERLHEAGLLRPARAGESLRPLSVE